MKEDVLQIFYTGKNVNEMEYYAKMFQTIEENGKGLMNLNVNRGGPNNFGFVYEYNTASVENIKSLAVGDHCTYEVVNNNGVCDIIGRNSVTHETTMYQLKAPSMNKTSIRNNLKPDKYPNQTMVTPLENRAASKYVTESGGISKRSLSTRAGAEIRSDIGKLEANIMKTKTAPIVGSIDLVRNQVMATTAAGVKTAGDAGALAAGLSIGKNMTELWEGNKEIEEAVSDVVKDTGKAAGTGFAVGAASYAIAGVASHSAAVMTVVQSASGLLTTIGPLSVMTTIGAGPLFLAGIALGVGINLCCSIRRNKKQYRELLDDKYGVLYEELASFQKIYNELNQKLKGYCDILNEYITEGMNHMLFAIEKNDFELFSNGLDLVLSGFDKSALFKDMRQFDQFFYNEDAVLDF